MALFKLTYMPNMLFWPSFLREVTHVYDGDVVWLVWCKGEEP